MDYTTYTQLWAEAHDVICERGDGWYVDEEFKLSL